jgi:hypothetical protein
VRRRSCRLVEKAIEKHDRRGLPPFALLEGSIGNRARAIGGASLPFLAMFMRDRELLFRDGSQARPADAQKVHLSRTSAF